MKRKRLKLKRVRTISAEAVWFDAEGNGHEIQTMNTTHIANALRMLERKEWAKLPASMSQKLKRQVVRLAMKEKCEYTDLWKEFEKRLTKGWVRLDHLFSCAPKGTRFVRVSKR